jgi:NitT/TauT family transport system ATP-binding protein
MTSDESSENSLLGVYNIKYAYPAVQNDFSTPALRHVSFNVPHKQFCSIVGKSGCGKTTLLRLVAGLILPSVGTITLDGKNVTDTNKFASVVFQDYNKSLMPWLNIRENILLGLINHRNLENKEKANRVDEYLNLVGLASNETKYPWQLSGGMQQRVALARALAIHPKLLLLDEPFGSLDTPTRINLEDELLMLTKKLGTTVLMITHDIDEAVYMSDRILVMNKVGTLDTFGIDKEEIDISVNLGKDRKQIQTRQSLEYHKCREKILFKLQLIHQGELS